VTRPYPSAAAPELRGASRLLVLSDLDGTLIPIRTRPDLAVMDRRTRTVLRRVARAPGVRLGIVSGRKLSALRRAVGLPGLVYVGNHGLELAVPGRTMVVPAARKSAALIARLGREIAGAVRGIRGAFVEPKGYTLSVHWRGVSARDARRFHRAVESIVRPWLAKRAVRVTPGKRVIEVRPPVEWDKGSAVDWLARRWRHGRGELMYFGDDRTDEDAFRAVNRRGGVTVHVGPRVRSTAARWRLDGPRDVVKMLEQLEETRCRQSPQGR
jgi:trehalose 6-phosphate phosphatase